MLPNRSLIALLLGLALLATGPSLAHASAAPEPDVTTREEEDRTVREYRINDALYAIEIRPAQGASYYLVDQDGDGNFVRQEDNGTDVPSWVPRSP